MEEKIVNFRITFKPSMVEGAMEKPAIVTNLVKSVKLVNGYPCGYVLYNDLDSLYDDIANMKFIRTYYDSNITMLSVDSILAIDIV